MGTTNLATNPRAATLTNYTGEGSAQTPTPTLATGAPVSSVTNQVVVRATVANTYLGVQYKHAGVTAGQVYSFSGYMATDSLAGTFQMYVIWTNASGGTVSVSTGPSTPAAGGAWVRTTFDNVTAPAGATGATVIFRKLAAIASGNLVVVTAVMVVQAASTPAYGDGATPGWYWVGVADASASFQPKTTPLLVPVPIMAPVPHVEITVPEVIPGTQTATMYRITADRTYRVRGMVQVAGAGGFGGIDTEPPFGIEVTYRAEMFNSSGISLGFTEPATTVVAFSGTVFHQPIAPARSVQVELARGAAAEISRPFQGETVRPIGRSVPVYIGTGRTGLTDINLDSITYSAEDAAALESVFGGYDGDEQLPVVCFRSSLPTGLPPVLFAVIAQPKRKPFDAHLGGTGIEWELSGAEVAPPVEAIVQALLTYGDVESVFSDYASLESAYLTYLDMETDFDLAGA